MPTTPNLESLIFFGDSLSDNGNLSDLSTAVLTTRLVGADGGYSDRFTNIEAVGDGLMWTDSVGDRLGASAVYSFAYGGALVSAGRVQTVEGAFGGRGLDFLAREVFLNEDGTADFSSLGGAERPGDFLSTLPDGLAGTLTAVNDINLGGQVANAVATLANGSLAGPGAAVFLGGGNDYVGFALALPTIHPSAATDDIIAEFFALSLEGAVTFLGEETDVEVVTSGVGFGLRGDDRLFGVGDEVALFGGTGDDTMIGADDVVLVGGAGDDVILGRGAPTCCRAATATTSCGAASATT